MRGLSRDVFNTESPPNVFNFSRSHFSSFFLLTDFSKKTKALERVSCWQIGVEVLFSRRLGTRCRLSVHPKLVQLSHMNRTETTILCKFVHLKPKAMLKSVERYNYLNLSAVDCAAAVAVSEQG